MVSFVRAGLTRREACACVVADEVAEQLTMALSSSAADCRYEVDRGALTFVSGEEYRVCGEFDPKLMLASVIEAAGQAVAIGFTGLRIAEDAAWTLAADVGRDELKSFEALSNEPVSGVNAPLRLCE